MPAVCILLQNNTQNRASRTQFLQPVYNLALIQPMLHEQDTSIIAVKQNWVTEWVTMAKCDKYNWLYSRSYVKVHSFLHKGDM